MDFEMAVEGQYLTKDEKWLEIEFKVDLSKLDKSDLEGGKNRFQFLKLIHDFRNNWGVLDDHYIDMTKLKDLNTEQKRNQADMEKAWNKAVVQVKACNISKAYAYAIVCKVAMRGLAGDIVGPAPKLTIAPTGRNYRVCTKAMKAMTR